MATVEVTTEFLTDVADHVEKASAVFDGIDKKSADVEAQAKATLNELKKQGLVPEGVDDEALVAKLCDPVEALVSLGKTARLVSPPSLGEPAEVKEASTSGQSSSDAQFEVALGL